MLLSKLFSRKSQPEPKVDNLQLPENFDELTDKELENICDNPSGREYLSIPTLNPKNEGLNIRVHTPITPGLYIELNKNK